MRSLLWLAAATALPVVVTVLVFAAVTFAVLLATAGGVGHLFPVVAVEWFVLAHVPLSADGVEIGVLPLVPVLLFVGVLARQTRAALDDVERPGPAEVAAAVLGPALAAMVLTGIAVVVIGSAQSDFAVRERSLPEALAWSAATAAVGAGLGAWFHRRRALRDHLPDWFRGGLHLGTAFLAATAVLGALLVLVGLVCSWTAVGDSLTLGKGGWGTLCLAAISIGYLPNVVLGAATVALGGEAHVGEASYSLFAVNRGPMPEIPLAHALPVTSPHWAFQGVLLLTVIAAALLTRAVAHWFVSISEGVKAAWTAAAVAALGVALVPVVAGGTLGVIGELGTGALIASAVAFVLFGVIGSLTVALSLAGLTRRRERERTELERRRRRLARAEGRDPDAETAPETPGRETAADAWDGGYDDALDEGYDDPGDADETSGPADDDADAVRSPRLSVVGTTDESSPGEQEDEDGNEGTVPHGSGSGAVRVDAAEGASDRVPENTSERPAHDAAEDEEGHESTDETGGDPEPDSASGGRGRSD